jgi:hypothetical protein
VKDCGEGKLRRIRSDANILMRYSTKSTTV